MLKVSVGMCCNPGGEKYSRKRMSFGRDTSTALPNLHCVQIINVAVSVVSGYITEEEREHSVIDDWSSTLTDQMELDEEGN